MSPSLSRGKTLVTDGVGIDHSQLPPFEDGRIDPGEWFDQSRPLEIEIGSGKGTFLVQEARARPEANYLGIEYAAPYYRYAADRARRWDLPNVRMLRADGAEFIRFWCADDAVSAIHLYFSDPWPKTRHHKRRVLQDDSLREFHRVLRADGLLHLVTDHPELWSWYEEHAERNASLFSRREFVKPASALPEEWVGTNYERKFATGDGRPIHGMTLAKNA